VLIRAIVDSGTEEQLLMARIRISKNSLFMLQKTLDANAHSWGGETAQRF